MLRQKIGNGCAYGIAGLFAAAFVALNLAGIITLLVFLFSPLAFAEDSLAKNDKANAQCFSCHGKPDFSIDREGKTESLYVDSEAFKQSIHGTRTCISCHSDLGGVPHKKAVYGQELIKQVNSRCMECHDDVAKVYATSTHLVAEGKQGAYCQDCHGTHDIKQKDNTEALAYRLNIPKTCTKCHQGNVEKSYDYSFHGTSVKLGYQSSATCADCHGTHEILGPENTNSLVAKENLPQTCAKCHLEARPNFANGSEHVVPQDKENAFSMWIIWKIFLGLIIFDVFKDGSIAIFELIRRLLNTRKKA